MRYLVCLFWAIVWCVASVPLIAQQLEPVGGSCRSADLSTAWTSTEENCRLAGGNFYEWQNKGMSVLLGSSGSLSQPAAKCPADRQFVLVGTRWMCAKDLTEPE